MSNTQDTQERIDIGAYAEANPESRLLTRLAESADSSSHPHYEGWWSDLQHEDAEGVTEKDALLASYIAVMRPIDTKKFSEEAVIDMFRQLRTGQTVLRYGMDIFEEDSGVLEQDAGIQVNPTGYANVDIKLKYKDRADERVVSAGAYLAVGKEEITHLFSEDQVAPGPERLYGKTWINDRTLKFAGFIARTGLAEGDEKLTHINTKLLSGLDQVVQPKNVIRQSEEYFNRNDSYPQIADNLYYMHLFDPQLAETRIAEFASSYRFEVYKENLINAVARIRSPFQIDSLGKDEQKIWYHQAAAEIYQLRVAAQD